jgi:predicted transcriptional regulator
MTASDQALFVALRPAYAEMILSGVKTVELRRIRPKAQVGTLVLIYASSPARQVLGTCVVEDVGIGSPDEIWVLHGTQTGIGRAAFRTYFAGSPRGVAITVAHPRRLENPLSLEALRRHGFAPPQSFRYVPLSDAQALLGREWEAARQGSSLGSLHTLFKTETLTAG